MSDDGGLTAKSVHSLRAIDRAIAQTAAAVTKFVFDSNETDAIRDLLAKFSEREVLALRRQLTEFLVDAMAEDSDEAEIQERIKRIVHAHTMVGVQTSWVFDILGKLTDIFTAFAKENHLGGETTESLKAIATRRLNTLVSMSLTMESEYAERIQDALTGITLMSKDASTLSDLAREAIDLVSSVDGLSGVYFARPDTNGILKFEYIGGKEFDFFKSLVENDRLPEISVDPNRAEGLGPAGRAWRTGQVQVSSVIEFDPTMGLWSDIYLAMGIRSTAGVPIVNYKGQPQALFGLYSQWPAYFDAKSRVRFLDHLRHALSSGIGELNSSTVMSYETRQHYRLLLQQKSVEMLYQPIVHLQSGELHKLEALARLVDANGTRISPTEFLPALASDDLLILFEFGLNASLEALRQWSFEGLATKVAVNLPVQGLEDHRYLDMVEKMVNRGILLSDQITLELTEDEELRSSPNSQRTLHRFRELGIELSQDDLGSGYSSLQRLDSVGFDEVKIDQALVRNTKDPQNALKLIEHLTDLAHDLGVAVVVEGLESKALIEAAVTLGADYGQGYAISRPIQQQKVLQWYRGFEWPKASVSPTTNLGALASIQRWSKTVTALAAYPKVFGDEALVEELRQKLSSISTPNLEDGLNSLVLSLARGTGADFLTTLDSLKRSLMLTDHAPQFESSGQISRTQATTKELDSAAHAIEQVDQDRSSEAISGRLKGLLGLQRSLIGHLVQGSDPTAALDLLCRVAESISPHTVATVMVLRTDGNLHLVSGPSLAEEAKRDLSELTPGPNSGSWGNVIYQQRPVYVEDTLVDPSWTDLASVATKYGLRACWSVPVRGRDNSIIGTFALTKFDRGLPTPADKELLEQCASLASLALFELSRSTDPSHRLFSAPTYLATSQERMYLSFGASNGKIMSYSDNLPDWYDYSRAEFANLLIYDLNPNLTPQKLRSLAIIARNGKSIRMTSRHRLKSGEMRDVEYRTRVRNVDGIEVFETEYYDVTDELDVREIIHNERIVRDQILDATSALVFVVNPLGSIISLNRACSEFLAIEHHDLDGRPLPLIRYLIPGQSRKIQKSIVRSIGGDTDSAIEVQARDASGRVRTLETRVSPIEDSTGSVTALAFVAVDISERKTALDRAVRQGEFFSQVVESISNLLVILDTDGHIVRCNKSFEEFTGMPLSSLIDRRYVSQRFFTPATRQVALAWFTRAIAGDVEEETTAPWIGRDGERHIIAWKNTAIRDTEGRVVYLVCAGIDITQERLRSQQLQRAGVVFENAHEGIMIIDRQGLIKDVNRGFSRLNGYSRDEAIGKVYNFWCSERHDEATYREVAEALGREAYWTGTIWNHHKDGKEVPLLTHISAIRDSDGEARQYVIIFSDISDFVEMQRELSNLAFYDILTKLPNRSLLSERMSSAFARARRDNNFVALAYLDLDRFKPVNDQFGHTAGDELLIQVAERMVNTLREVDTVARIGGDEFVCLLPDIANSAMCTEIVERLIAKIGEPFVVGPEGEEVTLSASIGVVFYHGEEVEPDNLLRTADQLMYRAKRSGGKRYLMMDSSNSDDKEN